MTALDLRDIMDREGLTVKALSSATGIAESEIRRMRKYGVPKSAQNRINIALGIAVSTEERKTLLEGCKWSGGARFGIHSNSFWRR